MESKIIEAVNGPEGRETNWGKFMVLRPTAEEWRYESVVASGYPLLPRIGHGRNHIWVIDLQTCEGACFRPGGYAAADLDKHRIWVCVLYQPFLAWLYGQDLTDLASLPSFVRFSYEEAPGALSGYRREGTDKADIAIRKRIGEAMMRARMAAGISLEALASRIDRTPEHLTQLESGAAEATMNDFVMIATALGMAPTRLMAMAEEPPRPAPQS